MNVKTNIVKSVCAPYILTDIEIHCRAYFFFLFIERFLDQFETL